MTSRITERKLVPFYDIWGKILDFRLHKFKVTSILKECALSRKSRTPGKSAYFKNKYMVQAILFVDLVSDDILQMVLGSDLPRQFKRGISHTLLTNAICCTFIQLAAMPLSTKRIVSFYLAKGKIKTFHPF